MQDLKTLNIVFAATANMIPYAVVTALSIKDRMNPEYKLNIYYLWAETSFSDRDEFKKFSEYADFTFTNYDININYIEVTQYMHLFKGQNIGMWGEEISYTHYMYLLSPMVLSDLNKIIYLDTDMVVNCDLAEVYERDLGNHLLAMGAPRGKEDMGDDVSNSGFVVLNLDLWRKENTFETLMNFGRTLEPADFCDQYLLHEYFTKNHSDRLLLFEKELNIFPHFFPDMPMKDMKILHYTGGEIYKPSKDMEAKLKASCLWWHYAKQTAFYEMFLAQNINSVIKETEYIIQEKFNVHLEKRLEEYKEVCSMIFNNKLEEYKNKSFFRRLKRLIRVLRILFLK